MPAFISARTRANPLLPIALFGRRVAVINGETDSRKHPGFHCMAQLQSKSTVLVRGSQVKKAVRCIIFIYRAHILYVLGAQRLRYVTGNHGLTVLRKVLSQTETQHFPSQNPKSYSLRHHVLVMIKSHLRRRKFRSTLLSIVLHLLHSFLLRYVFFAEPELAIRFFDMRHQLLHFCHLTRQFVVLLLL